MTRNPIRNRKAMMLIAAAVLVVSGIATAAAIGLSRTADTEAETAAPPGAVATATLDGPADPSSTGQAPSPTAGMVDVLEHDDDAGPFLVPAYEDMEAARQQALAAAIAWVEMDPDETQEARTERLLEWFSEEQASSPPALSRPDLVHAGVRTEVVIDGEPFVWEGLSEQVGGTEYVQKFLVDIEFRAYWTIGPDDSNPSSLYTDVAGWTVEVPFRVNESGTGLEWGYAPYRIIEPELPGIPD